MNFSEAMDYILSFTDYERDPGQSLAPVNFNLDRIYRLLDEFGNPHKQFKSIHIAGTKGKGSTAATIAAVLSTAGFKTALFTSPHLHDFRERIRINGEMIAEQRLTAIIERMKFHVENVHSHHPALGRLTTFEVTAALAFVYFAEEKVNFAVVEVGLGGRLDATNVLNPLVAVLTPISLDHTQVLGSTVAEIAREKAGIIKQGGVVVSAPQPVEALDVFQQVIREKNARLLVVGADWRFMEESTVPGESGSINIIGLFDRYVGLKPRLLGRHQMVNAATAVAAIECLRFHDMVISADTIREGIRRVEWPGRLEVVSSAPRVIVDGAHNADSMARLREALEEYFRYRKLILIIGTSGDKDIAGIVHQIIPITHRVIVTQTKHPRSAPPSAIAKEVMDRNSDRGSAQLAVDIARDVPTALQMARDEADDEDLIVVTGSLFMVAEAREEFGLNRAEPRVQS